jgi:hypothetical protein
MKIFPPALLLYIKKMETLQERKNAGFSYDMYQLMPKETLQSLMEAEDLNFARKVVNAIN